MILDVINLEKTYGGPFKLGPVNMTMAGGETVALLGKNGAGKSTFFQLITGSMDASDGEVRFINKRLVPESYELKRKMGYLPQNLHLPKWVSANEILRYGAALFELGSRTSEIEHALKYWDCDWFAEQPIAACSHGMQKRIALALATIHDPELLILDEPFSGLDLYHIRALEQIINERNSKGKATILCTHIAPYAAKLCQRALIFDEGQMAWIDSWPDACQLERVGQIEQHFFAGLQE